MAPAMISVALTPYPSVSSRSALETRPGVAFRPCREGSSPSSARSDSTSSGMGSLCVSFGLAIAQMVTQLLDGCDRGGADPLRDRLPAQAGSDRVLSRQGLLQGGLVASARASRPGHAPQGQQAHVDR